MIAAVVWISGTVALAQAPAPKSPGIAAPADSKTGAQAPKAIPLAEVPGRVVTTSAELNALLPKLTGEAFRQTLERMHPELDRTLKEVESLSAKTREALAAPPNVRTLQQLATKLSEMRERLRNWDKELDRPLAGLRAALRRVDTIATVWEATAELARREATAGTTVTRIAAMRGEIDKARSTLVKQRNEILAVRDRLVDPRRALAASFKQLQSASAARRQGIFQLDRPPLWSPEVRESLGVEWDAGGPQKIWLGLQKEVQQYAGEWEDLLGLRLALFVALILGLRLLRDRARARAEGDYDLQQAERVFAGPWAMALMMTVILTTPFHPLAPRPMALIDGALFMVAALWIGRRFVVSALSPLPWGLAVFFLVDRARDFLNTVPTLERVVYQVEMVGALGFLFWLLRPGRLAGIPPELRRDPFLRLIGAAMRVTAAVLAIAIVADLAGWGNLAHSLGNVALRGSYAGFGLFVLLMVVQGLAAFALVLWPLRLLRVISRHRLLVRRRIERGLGVLAVGLWAMVMLAQLTLLDPVIAGIGGALGAGFSVGAFSISVGNVIAFALTVLLSFLLARLVNFVLEEDVFTRVRAGRGVPYAVSGLVRYALIFLGILIGLSAAGVELTKLSIIAGGLGVGIGFGLQNVVNNFVSGLILLFERPIQVGDTVQLPDVWGDIKRIGIRASVIRTFEGAEVIVPNGMLISEKVTNWTLSDKRRRIEVDVGVAYGTSAQRMIDLLLGVAKANPRVIAYPEPMAFFVNCGDSALEFKLRVWIENFDDGYPSRSELAVAIQEALSEAGIGVPFPQRDLHLVSVSPKAASELGTATRPSPLPAPPSDSGSGI
jgi:small-conductance mechanosensitive channel